MIKNKLEYLDKILQKLLLFSKHYNNVDIVVKGENVEVVWSQPKDWKWEYEKVEFPYEDIDKRIISYKSKLATNFKNRKNCEINKVEKV